MSSPQELIVLRNCRSAFSPVRAMSRFSAHSCSRRRRADSIWSRWSAGYRQVEGRLQGFAQIDAVVVGEQLELTWLRIHPVEQIDYGDARS